MLVGKNLHVKVIRPERSSARTTFLSLLRFSAQVLPLQVHIRCDFFEGFFRQRSLITVGGSQERSALRSDGAGQPNNQFLCFFPQFTELIVILSFANQAI